MNGFPARKRTQPPAVLPAQPFAGNFIASEALRGSKSPHNLGGIRGMSGNGCLEFETLRAASSVGGSITFPDGRARINREDQHLRCRAGSRACAVPTMTYERDASANAEQGRPLQQGISALRLWWGRCPRRVS